MVDQPNDKQAEGFKRFAVARILVAMVLIAALIWALTIGLGYLSEYLPKPEDTRTPSQTTVLEADTDHIEATEAATSHEATADDESLAVAEKHSIPGTPSTAPEEKEPPTATELSHDADQVQHVEGTEHPTPAVPDEETKVGSAEEHETPSTQAASPAVEDRQTMAESHTEAAAETPSEAHGATEPETKSTEAVSHEEKHLPTGVAFVQATIKPLENELNNRWWGWRPNDIVNVTDNVNNYQLGVLEVTRRTIVQLAERLSRTGSTDAFNPHLENAMNWIMVKADRYWFPSPESKYKEGLSELEAYKQQLIAGKASFYTRADNVIPLLIAFEDLLGSCDENLVKEKEKDGSKVGFFKSDNYFYYAKGITSAMAPILEAMHHDFTDVLEKRNGVELLHHAIQSCQRASDLNPWIITNGDLDGILANHRANIAAPISHAKFYIGQLVKTLST